MKLLLFTLSMLLTSTVQAQTPIEKEFYNYFKLEDGAIHSNDGRYHNGSSFAFDGISNNLGVKINVDSIQENTAVIEMEIEFAVKTVEKVLILRVPETGFKSDGFPLTEECLNAPVFIASYTFDPKKNIRGIDLRIKSWCRNNRIIVWIKTAINNGIMSGKAEFITTSGYDNF